MARKTNRTTSIDVARRAGVSQSAVSRAFTPGSSVSEEMRRKVLDAARELNYVPNSIARSLITARSNIVAMVIGDLANPFYSAVLDEFSSVLQQQGRHLLVFRVAPGSTIDDALQEVLQYQVDGIIVTSAQVSSKMAELCTRQGIPVVMFNRYIRGLAVDNVCCSNLKGGKLVGKTLLEAGGIRFAMIAGVRDTSTNRDRMQGYLRELRRSGIADDEVRIESGYYTYEGGYRAALSIFDKRKGAPDALFCINDIMALGAIDALRDELGYRVPEDVMIVGFDDIPEARRAPYRLTTVRQPRGEMIAKTVEILNRKSATRAEPETHFLEGTLVRRDTVRT